MIEISNTFNFFTAFFYTTFWTCLRDGFLACAAMAAGTYITWRIVRFIVAALSKGQ